MIAATINFAITTSCLENRSNKVDQSKEDEDGFADEDDIM